MTITERIDAVTHIDADYLREDPPFPKSVKIELSGRCNYACNFCALRTREAQPTKDMPMSLFRRITREMYEGGVGEIGVFFLGESLTAPGLTEEAIRYLKQDLGMPYVFLTTNASLLTPVLAYKLFRAGLDSLKFSVNAADEAQFREIMGVKPALFRAALENIKNARTVRDAVAAETGHRCGLYASSIRYDGAQLEKMEALLDEHIRPYVDQHYWLPLYSMAMRSPEIERKLGYKPTHGNSGRYDPATGTTTESGLPCWSAFKEGHVRCDGHVSLCCFGSDEKFDVGDLNVETFAEIWNGEAMRRVRRAQIATKVQGPAALRGSPCEVCVAYGPVA